VRQRWLRRWLFEPPAGPVLEIGCGDGRFLFWNRRRAQVVGLDAVPLFSREALATVDLVQGDARALPFADGAFRAVYSIDVLEHLDSAGLDAVMAVARRVLAPGGRLFIFTNSREPSTFQPVIDAQRHLSAMLRRHAIGDFATDDLRKSDHVKALNTFEDFVLLAAARLRCPPSSLLERHRPGLHRQRPDPGRRAPAVGCGVQGCGVLRGRGQGTEVRNQDSSRSQLAREAQR
jgi:SAM-dependent methyltransferase